MLIAQHDLAQAIPAALVALLDTPTERACPRCSGQLRSCLLRIDGATFWDDVWMCQRDGLWFSGGMLESLLASHSP